MPSLRGGAAGMDSCLASLGWAMPFPCPAPWAESRRFGECTCF
jgi:hypothetical protein